MTEYVIKLGGVTSWREFIEAFNLGMIRHVHGRWHGNLDALNDYLTWPDTFPYRLILQGWRTCVDAVKEEAHHTGRRILDLVWEVFQNKTTHAQIHFAPQSIPVFDIRWRTEPVVGLAAKMDESGDVAALPILADALEEAGCQHGELLNLCREPITPADGLWVILWCLGRL